MIRLVDEPPRDAVLAQLRIWQAEVDAVSEYAQRLATAKRLFQQRNRAENPTFASVRCALRAMCGDAEWCCYCERSQAAEIDHVRPKSLYPGAVFLWSNFLWVCGRCNRLKADQFGVVQGSRIRRLTRDSQTEPAAADPALIDPRVEDPSTSTPTPWPASGTGPTTSSQTSYRHISLRASATRLRFSETVTAPAFAGSPTRSYGSR